MDENASAKAGTGRAAARRVGIFRWCHGFFIEQRCMPWRVRMWMGRRFPRLLVLLQTGRTNVNTARLWDAKWEDAGPAGARWCRFPKKFARICQIVEPKSKVLDVGCGVGILLEMLRGQGYCECSGVDISAKAIDMVRAKGFGGFVAKMPHLPIPDNEFDVAIGTELIEHLDAPNLTLSQMVRVVRPGGKVIISTPDSSLGTEDTLEHLHTFNANTLRELLEKFMADVHVEEIEEDGFESRFLLAYGIVRKTESAISDTKQA